MAVVDFSFLKTSETIFTIGEPCVVITKDGKGEKRTKREEQRLTEEIDKRLNINNDESFDRLRRNAKNWS